MQLLRLFAMYTKKGFALLATFLLLFQSLPVDADNTAELQDRHDHAHVQGQDGVVHIDRREELIHLQERAGLEERHYASLLSSMLADETQTATPGLPFGGTVSPLVEVLVLAPEKEAQVQAVAQAALPRTGHSRFVHWQAFCVPLALRLQPPKLSHRLSQRLAQAVLPQEVVLEVNRSFKFASQQTIHRTSNPKLDTTDPHGTDTSGQHIADTSNLDRGSNSRI
ncbi:hypothetical protein N7448_006392 [Penicillium atrosanguineum]|uniref:Uncharacterized protein n=1 Tax=Penicillium atrosanguineum TaxID=1132637 RepID=A0A9W9GZR4_9EURO|nr:uncharacterized protein N7443_010152 [Penicillium atrosanguineum]KAJ5132234.1 hypothetical protein N7448_006392 [Penicillium atrosanguineum]KAJ5137555.1 hypothetical protein N7526_003788 [Penicillium atrosanguineum]KAJ5289899.1 hypothetical protein N7443_010152 [Penicillium atrosanguineum]KAJ5307723.1 hypothetical protein N7476_008379 [Penicillium atrosanguineum]